MKEVNYYVSGMHCASCEINIERKILGIEGVKSASASTVDEVITIETDGEAPSAHQLNALFKKEKYTFSEKPFPNKKNSETKNGWVVFYSVIVIAAFILLNKLGLGGLLNVGASPSLSIIFLFGIFAGVSSCAALVGGLVLSMSKQWGEVYSVKDSTIKKLEPHLIFNLGRVISYGFFGAILGGIGKQIRLSQNLAPFLIIAVSVVMVTLGLQMIGVRAFRKFQITMPKIILRDIADERNFKGKYMPFILGALTFFLPCGYTLAVQALALLSGSIVQGGFIMMAFALGTLPILMIIGLSAVKLSNNPRISTTFNKVAAILVIFFALFNINAQLNVLGYFSLSDVKFSLPKGSVESDINRAFSGSGSVTDVESQSELPPIVNGKQIVTMEASATQYSPSRLKARAGVPIRWEIKDTGTSGCTNAIVARDIFDGQIDLTVGTTSIKEFTIDKPGIYKFSCSMGMVNGTIEIVK